MKKPNTKAELILWLIVIYVCWLFISSCRHKTTLIIKRNLVIEECYPKDTFWVYDGDTTFIRQFNDSQFTLQKYYHDKNQIDIITNHISVDTIVMH